MLDKIELTKIYKEFGFIEEKFADINIAIYSINTGHYHNADIIPLTKDANINKAFLQYTELGYACQIKEYESSIDAHTELFNGFFCVDTTKHHLIKEYKNFTDAIVKIHSSNATYSFINSKYFINETLGSSTVVDEIINKLSQNKPILFLIEAAAGFGKTCTAYELLNYLITNKNKKVPLFSELSRNRQAKIFRYVLLDEIDRNFPLLSSSLVRSEIKSGNVPVILDGFDELLRESSDDNENTYEQTEPMLETISELLIDKAKIILTTRRTAIFDGDSFHDWISSHESDFDVVRIRIDEPQVEDWLEPERLNAINQTGFPIFKLSNPVLLSFLRCISLDEFNQVIEDPTKIVKKYFDSMLERERKRQHLLMSIDDQYKVLCRIASDMIKFNYTSESRDYIFSLILENNQQLLESTRKLYNIDERPTTDELVNKLVSHALLDRSGNDSQGIGFVNEFVLGNFVSDNIIDDKSNEWVGDVKFIESAVQSYIPRTEDEKSILWHSIEFTLNFMSGRDKILYSQSLLGYVPLELKNDNVEQLTYNNLKLGDKNKIIDTIFIDCNFYHCEFFCNSFDNVTFINTIFNDCNFIEINRDQSIHLLGCNSNPPIEFDDLLVEDMNDSNISDCDMYVLEKFCPKGRDGYIKHRPIKGICIRNNLYSTAEIINSIKKLKKEKLLLTPDKRSFLELNMERISDINDILGRI